MKRRVGNLLAALEEGGDSAALVKQLRTQESRQAALVAELASLRPIPRLEPAVVQDRLAEWRRMLRGSTTQARAVIQRVVDGRITFKVREDGLGYDFIARTRFDRVFTGIHIQASAAMLADAQALNGVFDATQTLDADYGLLLANFYGKCMASPTGLPNLWRETIRGMDSPLSLEPKHGLQISLSLQLFTPFVF